MNDASVPPLSAEAVEQATGWRVFAYDELDSTNDEAKLLLRRGVACARTAVVAAGQRRGRGRDGRRFHSPPGGLYGSFLVAAPSAADPAPLVAAAAVATCVALEAIGVPRVEVKWPNDIWTVEGRKLAGILVERAEGEAVAIVGLGLNMVAVPADLEPTVAVRTACLAAALGEDAALPSRTEFLLHFLPALERLVALAGSPEGRLELEDAWRERLALRGCPVFFTCAGRTEAGTFEDASFTEGLLVRDLSGSPRWFPAAHAADLESAVAAGPSP